MKRPLPSAQTKRWGEAGPVRTLLGGEDSPAALFNRGQRTGVSMGRPRRKAELCNQSVPKLNLFHVRRGPLFERHVLDCFPGAVGQHIFVPGIDLGGWIFLRIGSIRRVLIAEWRRTRTVLPGEPSIPRNSMSSLWAIGLFSPDLILVSRKPSFVADPRILAL